MKGHSNTAVEEEKEGGQVWKKDSKGGVAVNLSSQQEQEPYIIKGKYKLINFYKAGGFGQIFFAKHLEKGYEVAVKVSDNANEETKRQYENEVEVFKIFKRVAGIKSKITLELVN